jgi:putative ABC transport system permease protein
MIVRWTLKSLFESPLAAIGSAAAVAAALALVILFEGIWLGEADQVVAYPDHTAADVWVMQRGVSNMHMATSLMPDNKRRAVAGVEGVAGVAPILYLNTLVKAGDRRSFSYVVGITETSRRGGPWSMSSGQTTLRPGEAIIPDVLASLSGVGLGGRIRIADRWLDVVGLSSGTYSMANPVTFAHARDVAELLSIQGYDSYLLVRTAQGADPAAVAQRIETSVDGVAALTKAEFVASDRRMAMQMGIEVIELITLIGTVLAAVLVAFTLYTHTTRKRRELSILKALGFRASQLLGSVILQALLLTALGFGLAVVFAYVGLFATNELVPEVAMQLSGGILLKVAAGALVVALIAAVVPARQVIRVDPHSVFQS